jgi:hypothetical protein
MRLWSIHPSYLDTKGLVAAWREGLLAKAVLEGKTKGYKNHPQLHRFKSHTDPVLAIKVYLHVLYLESLDRGYKFDESKIDADFTKEYNPIHVNEGQLQFEYVHLLNKLETRDNSKYLKLRDNMNIKHNNMFRVIAGPIESWEKVL